MAIAMVNDQLPQLGRHDGDGRRYSRGAVLSHGVTGPATSRMWTFLRLGLRFAHYFDVPIFFSFYPHVFTKII